MPALAACWGGMSTSVDWRRYLCCPACRSGLVPSKTVLTCGECGACYEATPAGVLILLTEEDRRQFAALLEQVSAAKMAEVYGRRTRRDWRARLWRALSPPLPVYVNRAKAPLPRKENGLNLWLGGGGRETPGFLNLDLAPFYGVDLVANAARLPLVAEACDNVLCHAMLEHVEEPAVVVAEIERVLKPGGHVHAVVPFCHPWHGYPSDYHRFTQDGLADLFGRFERVSLGVYTGPTTTLLTFLLHYWKLIFPVHGGNAVRRWFNRAVVAVWGWVSAPLRYLDVWLNRRADAHTLANTLYILARKPARR